LFRTFIVGIILGIAAGIAALYYVPVVDQFREQSMITVSPNGGNLEGFHVNVPMDRIMIGVPAQSSPLPVGLQWPDNPEAAGLRAELFKIRNRKDAVVGVASRMAASGGAAGDIIEWVLHLPARGSIYATLGPDAADGGYRTGALRAGSREFEGMQGQLTERWIADTSGAEEAPAGRIELTTVLVGREEPER
jgi:hypothetical protein